MKAGWATRVEILCEGFDGQAQMYVGRSYADSPDVDGHVYFTAEEDLVPGALFRCALPAVWTVT